MVFYQFSESISGKFPWVIDVIGRNWTNNGAPSSTVARQLTVPAQVTLQYRSAETADTVLFENLLRVTHNRIERPLNSKISAP